MLSHFEKDGFRPFHARIATLFRDFLDITGLMDLDLKGCGFTWFSNPRNGRVTKEKLDRVLVNWPWRLFFPHALAMALPTVTSDHSPILLHLVPKVKSGRSFNFESFWADHEECVDVVKQGWLAGGNQVDPWANVFTRSTKCKQVLSSWQRRTFCKADQEIQRLKIQLEGSLNRQP